LTKASVFVLREREGRTQLLVFEHPSAGLQVPAGTVEPHEDARAGARRELLEESGLEVDPEQLRWVTRETWQHAADGHVFRFGWCDLDPKPELAGEQSRWLELVLAQLAERA
jgi:8-oxo-dGTP pyrophosphatase MutT (NUDIX family)